ncbi:MAG: isopentenyl-diphosphate Delta-isomerase, partial [Rubricoccaceae bacterium]|nr:isopentenyl-diphosphate Delta-isomerase [Rubricoccaceae bacterium]
MMRSTTENELVVLVDTHGAPIGTMDKMKAHMEGTLHKAFSVFVLNSDGHFLLQKRAATKYHSGGLWSNTCCSHPRPHETAMESAHRRLAEEMGLACDLSHSFSFIYRAELDNGLIEYEHDCVFVGYSDMMPTLNPVEASDWRYASADKILHEMKTIPEAFSAWFLLC